MEIKEMLVKVANEGGELLMKAVNKAHADSMRVTAFYNRKKLPSQLRLENVGIQIKEKEGTFYLRIFDRKIDGAEVFTVDKQTGNLIPVVEVSKETQRIVDLMRQDGVTEEEIEEYLKNM